MAEQAPRWDEDERSFDMRALLRLAIWGAAATACLAVVVLAANSDVGSQRLMTAMAPASSQPRAAELGARPGELETETRRLAEAVQTLDAERARLLTRITSLERSIDDITGSIRRQATSAPTTNAPATIATAVDAAPANPTARESDLPVIESAPPPAAIAAISPPASAAGRLAALPAADDVPEAKTAKPEIAVDVGAAANFDGLRLLWNSIRGVHAALLEDLHPLAAVRENRRTRAIELDLLVGPFTDAEAAASVCAALAGIRRFCQPAAFEGQQFSLAEPESKPVVTPRRRPATVPAPKTPRQHPDL